MPINMRFRFSPARDGLVKVLGPLETQIMQLVWQEDRSTVKKVHRKLQLERDIAYTTVMTTMSRLSEKGVLNRHREGLAYVYSAAITEEAFVTMVVHQVLDGLLDDYSETAVDYMVNYLAERNPSELKRLQRTINAKVAA